MKKNDIKHDPVRDFILDLISKIKDRWQTVSLVAVSILVIVPLALNLYSKDAESDYSVCLLSDISQDIVSISKYCESDLAIETVSKNDKDSLSSNIGMFAFIKNIDSMSLEEKNIKLEQADLSQVQNKLIRSKFYEFYGDVLRELSNTSMSKQKYLKAIEISESEFHLAVLRFKLSHLLFSEGNFIEAKENIDQALEHDFADSGIAKKIDILKGRVDQAISRD